MLILIQKLYCGPGWGQIRNPKLGMKDTNRLGPDLAAWDPVVS